MSNVLLRRNSSKQGLQNLTRLTTQRSIEDAEEAERERRQRTRNSLRQRNSGLTSEESSPESEMQVKENTWGGDLRASGSPYIEVDEGFSDWTQRKDKLRHQQELSLGGSEENLEEDLENKIVPNRFPQAFTVSPSQSQKPEQKDPASTREMERRSEHEQDAWKGKEKQEKMLISTRKEEIQEPKTKQSDGAVLEAEHRLEKIQLELQEENQELERLRNRQAETKQNLQELRKRMEDQHQLQEEEEEEHQKKEEQHKRLSKEEDSKGLKVGTANRILQWVKGPSDGCSRQSTFRPITVKPGDVMQKKSMWEIMGDSSGSLEQRVKPSAAGKKYKFIITGHGKYEKIPADNKNDDEPN